MSARKIIDCDCGYGDCGVYVHALDCPAVAFDPVTFVGVRVDKIITNEAEHFMTCAACGQAYDMRLLAEVMHHETPGHSRRVVQ